MASSLLLLFYTVNTFCLYVYICLGLTFLLIAFASLLHYLFFLYGFFSEGLLIVNVFSLCLKMSFFVSHLSFVIISLGCVGMNFFHFSLFGVHWIFWNIYIYVFYQTLKVFSHYFSKFFEQHILPPLLSGVWWW